MKLPPLMYVTVRSFTEGLGNAGDFREDRQDAYNDYADARDATDFVRVLLIANDIETGEPESVRDVTEDFERLYMERAA